MRSILFTGGGSAGHVVPNLAVMEELRGSFRLSYMGTDGMERALVASFGCPYHTVNCPKLERTFTLRNAAFPFRLAAAKKRARAILNETRPDLVFSKGGYASYPAVYAAHTLNIPVLTHESDLTPGLCTRVIARYCRCVLTSFPETAARFRNGTCVGSPVRRELFSGKREDALRKYGLGKKPVLLVLGGGSGSRTLNDAVRSRLGELLTDFDILHLCGKGNLTANAPAGYVQREYEQDMTSAYACCDIVLSRAGSNTVFELLCLQKPALLVPLGRATRGDQIANAEYFRGKELCAVLRENELGSLPSALLCLYGNAKVRDCLRVRNEQSGTKNIVSVIRSVLG